VMVNKAGIQFKVNFDEARVTNSSGETVNVKWTHGTKQNEFSTVTKNAPVVSGTAAIVPSDAEVCTAGVQYKVEVTSASGKKIVTWILKGKISGSRSVALGIFTFGVSALIPSQGYIWAEEV